MKTLFFLVAVLLPAIAAAKIVGQAQITINVGKAVKLCAGKSAANLEDALLARTSVVLVFDSEGRHAVSGSKGNPTSMQNPRNGSGWSVAFLDSTLVLNVSVDRKVHRLVLGRVVPVESQPSDFRFAPTAEEIVAIESPESIR